MVKSPDRATVAKVFGQAGKTSKVERDILNAARMATFSRVPKGAAADRWAEAILVRTLSFEAEHHLRKRARRKKDQISFARACSAFALDLVDHSGNAESEGFCYRAFDWEELAESLVSSVHFSQLINIWRELGWLEMTGHIDARPQTNYAKVRRYRATLLFLTLAADFGITSETVKAHSETSHRHAELIQLRTKKDRPYGQPTRGNKVRYGGAKFDACREQIERLNGYLRRHSYSLSETPIVCRKFNRADRPGFDLDLGGSFYCLSGDNWMEMPKEERRKILIDGEPTVEVDVRASHLSILYALRRKRLDTDRDPYAIGEYPREAIKKIVVTAMGKGGIPSRWPKDFNSDYEKEHGYQLRQRYRLKDVTAAIWSRHTVLKYLREDQLDWANLRSAFWRRCWLCITAASLRCRFTIASLSDRMTRPAPRKPFARRMLIGWGSRQQSRSPIAFGRSRSGQAFPMRP